jgi:hypothetical protein
MNLPGMLLAENLKIVTGAFFRDSCSLILTAGVLSDLSFIVGIHVRTSNYYQTVRFPVRKKHNIQIKKLVRLLSLSPEIA